MLAYQKFGKGKTPLKDKKKSDHFVGDFYVKFNEEAEKNPGLEEEAKDMLQKWEKKDKDVMKLWKTMSTWAYEGFEETYDRLGVSFDKYYYESDFYGKGKDIVLNGLKKGLFKRDENGALIVELGKYGLPDKVLLRGDGTSIYMTQDLYLAQKKFKDYKLDKSIYIVASEQNMHFRQLFRIFELLGFPWAKKCRHMSYGLVNLPEGKMKSREGTVVDADDIVQEMVNTARQHTEELGKIKDFEPIFREAPEDLRDWKIDASKAEKILSSLGDLGEKGPLGTIDPSDLEAVNSALQKKHQPTQFFEQRVVNLVDEFNRKFGVRVPLRLSGGRLWEPAKTKSPDAADLSSLEDALTQNKDNQVISFDKDHKIMSIKRAPTNHKSADTLLSFLQGQRNFVGMNCVNYYCLAPILEEMMIMMMMMHFLCVKGTIMEMIWMIIVSSYHQHHQ